MIMCVWRGWCDDFSFSERTTGEFNAFDALVHCAVGATKFDGIWRGKKKKLKWERERCGGYMFLSLKCRLHHDHNDENELMNFVFIFFRRFRWFGNFVSASNRKSFSFLFSLLRTKLMLFDCVFQKLIRFSVTTMPCRMYHSIMPKCSCFVATKTENKSKLINSN